MKEKEDLCMTFDPSVNEVLGVFGNDIHVKGYEAVLVMPIKEYFRIWDIWVKAKRRYCEDNKAYCGVMGYTYPKKYRMAVNPVHLNEYREVEDNDINDGIEVVKIEYPVVIVEKFEDVVDMEHG